ncbi:DUF1614 domain-containing protein [uncultured Methanoregula sp.]|uniref:DUF1614 domain-containing protein n=1 Tax=uncultured Methanoregula sp. TaxID=1005933 RepID=UPI002AAB63E0|nr:DUF1614 domain-containing protein [uncultured Methanoregula sp.]
MSDGVRVYSGAGALSVFAIILLVILVILLIPLLLLGIIGTAFTRLGFSWIAAIAVILLMLFGSFINIPIYRVKRDMIRVPDENPSGFDIPTPFMSSQVWETLISVNFGGAIIPVCIAFYLLYRASLITGSSLLLPTAVCLVIVAGVSFVATRMISGYGIKVSLIIPALTALLIGIIVSGGTGLAAAVPACAGGILGTLIGGNIAHLFRIKDIEIPQVSIGGSGTFGAVFLCCVLPALIA